MENLKNMKSHVEFKIRLNLEMHGKLKKLNEETAEMEKVSGYILNHSFLNKSLLQPLLLYDSETMVVETDNQNWKN